MTGLLSGHVGLPIAEFLPPSLVAAAERIYDTCADPGDSTAYEERVVHEGRETWFRTTLTAMLSAAGGGLLLVGVAADVTEERRRITRDAESLAALTQRNEDLRSFAGLVAHDMRSPLATVRMAAGLLLREPEALGKDKLGMVRMCERVADNCLASIDEVMDEISRQETPGQRETEFDIGDLCREIADIVDPEGRLVIAVPEGRVRSEKAVLQLALRNLLDNASRSARSRIDIDIEIDDPGAGRGMLHLIVCDDGSGLPSGFDFERHVEPGRAVDVSRHGFGLRAVVRLLRSRGGNLSCESDAAGSRFELTVPGGLLRDAGRRERSVASAALERGVVVGEVRGDVADDVEPLAADGGQREGRRRVVQEAAGGHVDPRRAAGKG